jgi:hypothetical protein
MAAGWFDNFRRVLGWLSNRVAEPIDLTISKAVLFECRGRGTAMESVDKPTIHETRLRPTTYDAARVR